MDQPSESAWAVVLTEDGKSWSEKRSDDGMSGKLENLKRKWSSQHPESCPSKEFSVMIHSGELVYVGRYSEGVVLRLSDKEGQVVFLTREMALELGAKLSERT